jgi:TetR/AcrR family transcriptional repressor of nem operon
MDKKEIRKNEILRDSIKLMYLKGYNSTSVNDIAQAASIPKGSFYNYFKDKEHYAVEAVKYYRSVLVKENLALLSEAGISPNERIKGFFNNGIDQLIEHDYKLGCFAGNLAQEMGDISDSISGEITGFCDHVAHLVYLNLLEARDIGELNDELDLKSLAGFMICAWQGTLMRAKVARSRQALDEYLYILNNVILK